MSVHQSSKRDQLTSELSLASDLSEKLCEVGKILGKELGAEDNVFAGVCRGDLTTEKLSLTGDPQSRALEGSLFQERKISIKVCNREGPIDGRGRGP